MEFRPASLADYAVLFPQRGERFWRHAAAQILGGPAWTLWNSGRRLLLAGLHPFADGILEAWLLLPAGTRPPAGALKFLLDRALTVFPDKILIARVDDDNRSGQRLALLAGFEPLEEHLAGTRLRTWLRRRIEEAAP